ncbi:tetratricopeptide repeat protein [Vibrio sp.]|uniref:tetratricopeptide repeat protein n=1 Tax=Vibrio sp. TaxID=678 RepID=UPI003D1077F7
MSAINKALSELTNPSSNDRQPLLKAEVAPVRSKPVLPWLVGGFALSLAVGGWAVSQPGFFYSAQLNTQSELSTTTTSVPHTTAPENQPLAARTELVMLTAPTAKLAKGSDTFYPKHATPVAEQTAMPLTVETVPTADVSPVAKQVAKANPEPKAEPVAATKQTQLSNALQLAAVNTRQTSSATETQAVSSNAEISNIRIEQVELTPKQLADNAEQRAKKALDANNLAEAIGQYHEALRYTPGNERVRQQLAALYYGKGETRRAVDLLQKGIRINSSGETLRLALAKLLVKEKQPEAALSPLASLSDQPSEQYLSLRAALAQQVNQDAIALESYQMLVKMNPDNGRWWLGLAIQQERELELDKAQQSYQQALNSVGVSTNSQQFIRDRLAVLAQLQEASGAN